MNRGAREAGMASGFWGRRKGLLSWSWLKLQSLLPLLEDWRDTGVLWGVRPPGPLSGGCHLVGGAGKLLALVSADSGHSRLPLFPSA